MAEPADDAVRNAPVSKNSPTASQQHTATPSAIAHPDGPDAQGGSDGNQALKEAVANLHPRDLAANLDPNSPDAVAAGHDAQNSAPFISTPDNNQPDAPNEQGLPANTQKNDAV